MAIDAGPAGAMSGEGAALTPCRVYKSLQHAYTYLYVLPETDLQQLPDGLLERFGDPQHILDLELSAGSKLALADPDKVRAALASDGFYLQMPPGANHAVWRL